MLVDEDGVHARLILVRHGQSEWNRANLFTGWADVDLSEKGIVEAREAGAMLREEHFEVDVAFTSFLRRAIRTTCLMLSRMNQCWVPMLKTPALNEQHSGVLCGQNKHDLAEAVGAEKVMQWRRSFDYAPPPLPAKGLREVCLNDVRYRVSNTQVPQTESLRDCALRVDAAWRSSIAPALAQGKTVLVVSHGNTLRAFVKHLDAISDDDIFYVDLPTACPVVYDLDEKLKPIAPQGVWSRPWIVRRGRFLVDEVRVKKAQEAMRQQVLRDISVSAFSQQMVKPAVIGSKAKKAIVDIGGETYNVLERPPSYFLLESERIASEAKAEYNTFRQHSAASMRDLPGRKHEVAASIVFLRHGYSVWNDAGLYTGWADVELTNRGREEARRAGQLLRAAGTKRLEVVYTSVLKRSIKTAWLMLDEMELQWVPVRHSWRLNERHYGELQGLTKEACVERFGLKQVQRWLRGLHDKPSSWSDREKASSVDRRYREVDVPESESLHECKQRVLPLIEELREEARAAAARAAEVAPLGSNEYETPVIVVIASEHVIRAIVWAFEPLDEESVPLLDIPFSIPLVYQLDAQMQPLETPRADAPLSRGWYMGDPERVKAVQKEVHATVTDPERASSEGSCFLPEPGADMDKWVC